MQSRKSTRASVPLLPRYRASTGFEYVDGQCIDISVGGMFIASSSPCETGTLLKFECIVDGQSMPVKGVARVVWQRSNSGERDRPGGMGLQFVKLEPGTAELIEGLIREAQALGMTAPAHPLPASYTITDSFPPAERLSSASRLSVVSTVPVDSVDAAAVVPAPETRPESQRVPAGTTPREPGEPRAGSGAGLGAAGQPESMILSSRAAVLPGDGGAGSAMPAKLGSLARWISIAFAVFMLAWTFLR